MLVEIYSDVVCPWCYIGKRRFEKALSLFEDRDRVQVVWRPHQLDPTAPRTPSPVLEAYARKFGGPERAFRIVEHLTETAAGEGLEFHMEEGQRANTFDAHRLLWLAGKAGCQDAMKERLLRAYFTEGRDIGDVGELAALAGDIGLPPTEVRAFLESDEGADEVKEEMAIGVIRGVTAVPTFLFEGRFAVPGAQDPETLLAFLRRVRDRFESSTAPPDATGGADCDDGSCAV